MSTEETGRTEPAEPMDPRELTIAELNVLSKVVREVAKRQEWLSQRPGLPAQMVQEKQDSARRYWDLNFKLVRIRKYLRAWEEPS